MAGYKTLDAAKEIARIPGALAVIRTLVAHGVDQVRTSGGEICDLDRFIAEMVREPLQLQPTYEWQVFNVSGYPLGTVGYSEGNRMERHMPQRLTALQAEGWEIFSINIISSSRGFITARKAVQ